MLQYQNQKLASQLEVQKCDILQLENKVKTLQAQQSCHQDNFSLVSRLWQQLNEDLQLLTLRATGCGSQDISVLDSNAPTGPPPSPAFDPFLARLLDHCGGRLAAGSAEEPDTKFSPKGKGAAPMEETQEKNLRDVEAALARGSARTKAMLTRLLSAMDAERSRIDTVLANPTEELQKEVHRSHQDAAQLRRTADGLHARHRSLTEQLNSALEKNLKAETRIKELSGEMDNLTSDLQMATRKLANARAAEQSDHNSNSSNNNIHIGGSSTVNLGGGGKAAGPLQNQIAHLLVEKQELEATVSRREKEFEDSEKARLQALQEIRRAREEAEDGSSIVNSKQYQKLQHQYNALRVENEEYRLAVQQLQRERDLAIIRERDHLVKVEAGEAAARTVQLLETRLVEGEAREMSLRRERDETRVVLEKERAASSSGSSKTLEEYKQWAEQLQTQLDQMKKELEMHRATAATLEEVRAAKVTTESALATHTELLRASTQDKERLTASLEASSKQEVRLQHRIEHLELFVEILSEECGEGGAQGGGGGSGALAKRATEGGPHPAKGQSRDSGR